jgi:hypothetical protein
MGNTLVMPPSEREMDPRLCEERDCHGKIASSGLRDSDDARAGTYEKCSKSTIDNHKARNNI